MWSMQKWRHQNPNLLQLSISGQLWQPSILGHGYTGWHKENYYRVAMTGLTSRQLWYEHHWYSGELTAERCLSICLSVGSAFPALWVSEHYSINAIYHTPHQPIQCYYKTSNPPAYMPCFLHLLPLLFSLSFFHRHAFQESRVGKNRSLSLQPLFSISPHFPITISTQSQRFQSLVSCFSLASFSLSLSFLSSFALSQGCR